MEEKKEEIKKPEFIKWFNELDKDSGNVAGGKGANLGEIYKEVPVPPGFVVTAQAYDYFIEKAGIKEKISELLGTIKYEETSHLDEITKQIRAFIIDSKMPEEMEKDILEAYEHLDVKEEHIQKGTALDILNSSSEPIFVAVRSSATTEDLANASFAGQQDTYLNIKGRQELLNSVKKCFASLFTSRATYYRNKKGFKHEEAHLAVIVQKMIDSEKSGVIFSKDPSNRTEDIIIEAVWGLGEGIVSGQITPDRYTLSQELELKDKKIADKKIAITRDAAGNKKKVNLTSEKSEAQVLKEHEIKKLADYSIKLEQHFEKPQDIEFAIEKGEIYIVQTRPITTISSEKIIDEGEELEGQIITEGLGASPGIGAGKAKIIDDLSDLNKIKKGDILVTKMTNPDMVVSMQKSAAIVTDEGGLTAHASIVSREMGIPCVVGTRQATTKITDGEEITVDGTRGKIYRGKIAETSKKQVKPVETETKTKLKVIVDLPSFAERSAKTGIKKVGLTRLEGIIAESGKHPNYFLKKDQLEDYEKIIFNGLKQIAEHFEEIWVRTSDIRSDEYQQLEGAPQEKEPNPMLGMHGIRYGLKNQKILKAELNALKKIAERKTKIGVLFPQVILLDELKQVKEIISELNFESLKIGIMIETPAAVQLIKDFCEQGIDFISFGTNDLTQYMLAIDRGNEQVQELYDEMHPAILYQLAYVIRVCQRYKVETSICGQAGSKKEMVKYLVEKGIDSISVNADAAAAIAEYIAEIENKFIKGTDKEPRNYQPEKETEEKRSEKENISKNNLEQIEKDIQAIEEEKKQYLENKENSE